MASSSSTAKQNALIVGIDFGTTYSGVGWAFSSDPERIRTIRNWPGNRNNLDKVSTILSYGAAPAGKGRAGASDLPYRWGFDARPNGVSAGSELSWFKLLLKDQAQPYNSTLDTKSRRPANDKLGALYTTIQGLPAGKGPVDVVADYLRGLHKHLKYTLEAAYPQSLTDQLWKSIPVKYCLTVPAVWTDKAKALTVQAAKQAGMGEGLSEIRLISEPEAAAVHCLKTFQETQNCLKPGDVYVIADCGGGTVDLISYEVTAVTPRLLVKEAVSGVGEICGSITLNKRFMDLVQDCVGEDAFHKMTPQARSTTLAYFEDYLKKTFTPPTDDDEDDFEIESYYCPVPGVDNDAANGVQGGFLVLTADLVQGIFQSSFDKITQLVQEQVEQAEEKTKKAVTGVLLVGGYGSSDYLRQHLESNIHTTLDQYDESIKILQPVDAWTAIVRGAVLDGLSVHESHGQTGTRSMVQSRISRFSYGISACEPFLEGVHPLNKLFYSHRYGELMCRDRMSWFVLQGQEIPDGDPVRVNLRASVAVDAPDADLKLTQTVFVAKGDAPAPSDREAPGVQPLLTYTADASELDRQEHFELSTSPVDGSQFWALPIDMVMRYDSAELRFSTEIRPVGERGRVVVGKSPVVKFNLEPAKSLDEQMGALGI